MYSFYPNLFYKLKIVKTLEDILKAETYSSQTLQDLPYDQNLPINLT
ncbi:hypothetical protein NIES2100_76400 [Calothrix sp. NIES-2100]|nr:hypothetical protein NIES2100_76400 [Calothrix sp. NIES-2100]